MHNSWYAGVGVGDRETRKDKNKNTRSSCDAQGWEREDGRTVGVIRIQNRGGGARGAGAQASALGTFLAPCELARKVCDDKSRGC